LSTIEKTTIASSLERGDRGMLWTGRFLVDRKRALKQRLGVGMAALPLIKRRHIVQFGRDLPGIEAEHFLHDGDGSLVERFGLGVVAHIAVEQRQIVQGARNVAVDGTMRLLHVRQQLLCQRDRFGIFTSPAELLDIGTARGHALRRQRRREANAGEERQP
jgi:hypothetical protein